MSQETKYTEDNIRSLDWKEHIRMRPGMYIGKLGDGSSPDDGIYILLKEILDNSIDEYVMGVGKSIEVSIQGEKVTVRDFGRGIPLGKVVDVVSKMNTGGKYDSKAFKKFEFDRNLILENDVKKNKEILKKTSIYVDQIGKNLTKAKNEIVNNYEIARDKFRVIEQKNKLI